MNKNSSEKNLSKINFYGKLLELNANSRKLIYVNEIHWILMIDKIIEALQKSNY